MPLVLVNIGSAANDGTGDYMRTAFGKVNSNFTELYEITTAHSGSIAVNTSNIAANAAVITSHGSQLGSLEYVGSNRTYYVSTSGSDTYTGLSVGQAFRTIPRALQEVSRKHVPLGVTLKVSLQAGTHTLNAPAYMPRLAGGGSLVVEGNTGSPGSVVINASGTSEAAFAVNDGAVSTVRGFKINSTAGYTVGVAAFRNGVLYFDSLVFGTDLSMHIVAFSGGHVECPSGGSYFIESGGVAHTWAAGMGRIALSNTSVSLSSTPAFVQGFVMASSLSSVGIAGCTFNGAATGPRYSVTGNSIVDSGGDAEDYLPGNSPGATASGGQYL